MPVKTRNRSMHAPASMRGFSLLEVLIALLILAVGLLGFALMQTMGIRFAESSNYRTQAVNLAYDLLDQMRANRLLAAQYESATFAASAAPTSCPIAVGAMTIAQNITDWRCRVQLALGDGASANVTYNDGQATVTIRWDDQRWESNAARRQDKYETGTVTLGARL